MPSTKHSHCGSVMPTESLWTLLEPSTRTPDPVNDVSGVRTCVTSTRVTSRHASVSKRKTCACYGGVQRFVVYWPKVSFRVMNPRSVQKPRGVLVLNEWAGVIYYDSSCYRHHPKRELEDDVEVQDTDKEDLNALSKTVLCSACRKKLTLSIHELSFLEHRRPPNGS